MKQAVLLLAHGAPDRLEDVWPFLERVRGGRPLAREAAREIIRRYAAAGGSPFTTRTLEQARALEKRLASDGFPATVRVGMLHWRPSIREALEDLRSCGARRIVALHLAPQDTGHARRLCAQQIEEARCKLGWEVAIDWAGPLAEEPMLAEAFSQRLAPLLPCERVLFTAHSLPLKDPEVAQRFQHQVNATAWLIARLAGIGVFEVAYQSRGLSDDRWLEPPAEEVIGHYAAGQVREMVLAPIGFVADNIEILYDVDIALRDYALARGVRLRRPESLNDLPAFIAALACVVERRLEAV